MHGSVGQEMSAQFLVNGCIGGYIDCEETMEGDSRDRRLETAHRHVVHFTLQNMNQVQSVLCFDP
jgi:hypothetical protein